MKLLLTIIFFLTVCLIFANRILLVEDNDIEENLKNYKNKSNEK